MCIMQRGFVLSDQTVIFHTPPSFSTQIRPTLWLWQYLYFMLLQKLEVNEERDCGEKYKIISLDPISSFVAECWEILFTQAFHRRALIVSSFTF